MSIMANTPRTMTAILIGIIDITTNVLFRRERLLIMWWYWNKRSRWSILLILTFIQRFYQSWDCYKNLILHSKTYISNIIQHSVTSLTPTRLIYISKTSMLHITRSLCNRWFNNAGSVSQLRRNHGKFGQEQVATKINFWDIIRFATKHFALSNNHTVSYMTSQTMMSHRE